MRPRQRGHGGDPSRHPGPHWGHAQRYPVSLLPHVPEHRGQWPDLPLPLPAKAQPPRAPPAQEQTRRWLQGRSPPGNPLEPLCHLQNKGCVTGWLCGVASPGRHGAAGVGQAWETMPLRMEEKRLGTTRAHSGTGLLWGWAPARGWQPGPPSTRRDGHTLATRSLQRPPGAVSPTRHHGGEGA